MTNQKNIKNKIAVIVICVSFLIACMAAYDLGAKTTCVNSGGVLLSDYTCIINETLGYCITEEGKYAKMHYDMPGLFMPNIINISEDD